MSGIAFRTGQPRAEVAGEPQSGWVAGILAEDRRARERRELRRLDPTKGLPTPHASRRAVVWARAVGFDERLVPAAAMAASTLKALSGGRQVSKRQVLDRLRETNPELFEERES